MHIIKRDKYLQRIVPYIDKPIIKVLIGQRRVGKSFIMKQLISTLSERDDANIIYIDKEDAGFRFIKNDEDLYTYITSKIVHDEATRNYLLIDEIQEIDQFENSVRSFATKPNFDVYITGSNSEMLSGELATRLSGRYIEIPVYSLDFIEFCEFHKFDPSSTSLENYLRYGGMPFLMHLEMNDMQVNEYLKSVHANILYRDVVSRYNIRNVNFMDRLVRFLADNIGSMVSAHSISDYIKSQKMTVSVNTVLDYIHFLKNSQMIMELKKVDIKGKRNFTVGEKYYYQDWGIRNAISGYKISDINKILENCVLHHLLTHQFEVKIGDWQQKEIDFVAYRDAELVYIQVCYLLADQKTIDREFGNLLLIKDNYRKIVVSMDPVTGQSIEGIEHMQLLDFLLHFG